ncbi:hypothetical protein C9374_002362 [Naegleria lovaniensis]|uniref:Uncharacterized protein n=1 Tax=Naegleria lovaniensis TaxID=51637 RepID=A0AA88KLF5_NAELO|nr:uncharacterized protein C9374_002362 [Naegleria lovaniensis]KAG2386618.1 hypothetical protein C9374_002362 [Naegleria lovaniensis]
MPSSSGSSTNSSSSQGSYPLHQPYFGSMMMMGQHQQQQHMSPQHSVSSSSGTSSSTTSSHPPMNPASSSSFIQFIKNLPANSHFALGSEKNKPTYPVLPEFQIRIVNCDLLMYKCRSEGANCFLSCHIAATRHVINASSPTTEDIFTFSEYPLNSNMNLSDLLSGNYSSELGGNTVVSFKPKGYILNAPTDMYQYSKFTIKFQLILDTPTTLVENANIGNSGQKILLDQVQANSFEPPLIALSLKEDFSEDCKYIIGSLAGRAENLIKDGSKKISRPVVISFSPTLVDHYLSGGNTTSTHNNNSTTTTTTVATRKELYIHVYVRGEDGQDTQQDQFCLVKHDKIKLRPNIYSYTIDEQLGKLDKGDKKPQKNKFRLGVVLSTKLLVLNYKDFTKKMMKYRYPTKLKENPSLLYWLETNQFQCAKREEICKAPTKRKQSAISSIDDSNNNGGAGGLSPGLSSSGINMMPPISPPLGNAPKAIATELKNMLSLRMLKIMHGNDLDKQKLLSEFEEKTRQLLDLYNLLQGADEYRLVSFKFTAINPAEGREGTPVSVYSPTPLTEELKFTIQFGTQYLPYSGGITSRHTIGFNAPPNPMPEQSEYVITVHSKDAYVMVEPSEQVLIFKYLKDDQARLEQQVGSSLASQQQQQQDARMSGSYETSSSFRGLLGSSMSGEVMEDSFFTDPSFLDDNLACIFALGDFTKAKDYFQHHDLFDLLNVKDDIHQKLPLENAIHFKRNLFLYRVIPLLYNYWMDEVRDLNAQAKTLSDLYQSDSELCDALSQSMSSLQIQVSEDDNDDQEPMDSNTLSATTTQNDVGASRSISTQQHHQHATGSMDSPRILVSLDESVDPTTPSSQTQPQPQQPQNSQSSKLTAGKISRKSSFKEMLTKLFAVDSGITKSENASDDLNDIMMEIATSATPSPKHVTTFAKFDPQLTTRILAPTEVPNFLKPEEVENLAPLKHKLQRFENEFELKDIDKITQNLGTFSTLIHSYFEKEFHSSKVTIQLVLCAASNAKKNLKDKTALSNQGNNDFEEIFHNFDVSLQFNEDTNITWDTVRGISKITSKPLLNRLYASIDIFSVEGKQRVQAFIKKVAMTIAYWNVIQPQDTHSAHQFVESILLETGYLATCKSLFEAFASVVDIKKSPLVSEKNIKRKLNIPKEIQKSFSKKKWSFATLKDTYEFNDLLNMATTNSESNETLITDLTRIVHGFERALK